MAEYIKRQDDLNTGREKINAELTKSNNNAEKAKIDSSEALNIANQSMQQSQSTQDQLNQVIIEGDSSVEAAAARVDEENVTHTTLKERIDDGFTKTKTQLAEIGHVKHLKVVNPTMTQAEIQSVINEGGTINFTAGDYHVTPVDLVGFNIPSDTTLLLDSKVFIRLTSTNLERYYIFDLFNVKNVVIRGGNIIGDREQHEGTTGEWGHGIRISGSKNVVIDNVHVSKCWGDGVAIGANGTEPNLNHSENVVVRECILDHNRRLGMAITALKGGVIFNNEFINTVGTLPEAGLDLEPDRYMIVENVVIRDNKFKNNNKQGILISIRQSLIGYSFIRNILIDGNTIHENDGYGISVGQECTPTIISNNYILNNQGGILIRSNENQVISNVIRDSQSYAINLFGSIKNIINANTVEGNRSMGVVFQEGSNWNQFNSNKVIANYGNGVNVNSSNDNLFTNNLFENNGVEDNESNMYAGLNFISSSRSNYAANNKFNSGNHQEHGLRVGDNTSTSNIATNNDVRNGGTVSEIITRGANIQVGGGNFRLAGYVTTVDTE